MKIVRTVADACPNGIDCPRIHELSDGSILVRGYVVDDPDVLLELGLPAHESAVIIPKSLLKEAQL